MKKMLSIIIPFYNAEKTIGRALDSLNRLALESKELVEVLVIDDGSMDRGAEIAEVRKKYLAPLKVALIRQQNMGTAGARNTGLKQSSGDWIFFLDADDELVFDPVPYIQKWPGHSALAFPVQWFRDNRPRGFVRPPFITTETHFDILTAANPFQPANFIIRKDRIQSMFNVEFVYLEDWIFWFENPLIFESMKVFKNEISARIHVHGVNKSSNYEKAGVYREKVADEMLKCFDEKLTRKQKNNLLIQRQIGLILYGKKIKVDNFFRFPCNVKLYVKFIIYSILRTHFSRFDIYGT